MEDQLLKFEEVAKWLRLGSTAARKRLTQEDAPSPVRLSHRSLRWHASEITAWVQGLKDHPSANRTHRGGGRPRRHKV